MGEKIARIKLHESLVLDLLDFEGGRILRSVVDEYGNLEVTLTHTDLDEIEPGSIIPLIQPVYSNVFSPVRGSYSERVTPPKQTQLIVPPGHVLISRDEYDKLTGVEREPAGTPTTPDTLSPHTDPFEGIIIGGEEALYDGQFEEAYENEQFAQDGYLSSIDFAELSDDE